MNADVGVLSWDVARLVEEIEANRDICEIADRPTGGERFVCIVDRFEGIGGQEAQLRFVRRRENTVFSDTELWSEITAVG